MTPQSAPFLIAIDDEADIARFVADLAQQAGFDAVAVPSVRKYLEIEEARTPDIIVTDVCMPDTDGVELIFDLSKKGSRAGVILMSGYEGRFLELAQGLVETYGLHSAGNILKPFRASELMALLEGARRWVDERDRTEGRG